jgi:uncharacterized delta-60 repeat protein
MRIPSSRAGLRLALALVLLALLALDGVRPAPVLASSGDLDPTFGDHGIARTAFGGSAELLALAVQPDGKLVAAGMITWPAPFGAKPPEPTDFILARYNPDGSLDTGFGTAGWVVTDFDGGYDVATSLAIQSDGKFVAAGSSGRTGTPETAQPADFALARYQLDGTLDLEFGERGRARTSFGGHDTASGLVLQPDGKLVVAGSSLHWTQGTQSRGNASQPVKLVTDKGLALARFEPDGRLDPTFGSAGQVRVTFGFPEVDASDLVIQPDGRLVVGGVARVVLSGTLDFMVARFEPNGSSDHSFGAGGVVTTAFALHTAAPSLVL